MAKTHLITGGAGFVGVNLARVLIRGGDRVIAVDDLSRGKLRYLGDLANEPAFRFVELDCAKWQDLVASMAGEVVSDIWHLAANSDIPAGILDPEVDLNRTFLTTFGVARAAVAGGVPRVHFASSSAIYGDLGERQIVEDIGPLEPISNYGAMKLASEAQLRAIGETSGLDISIFRFPNVIGVPATHGVILDLVRKLHSSPDRLEVLGDGSQQKSYLHVDDLVDAMIHIATLPGPWRVFNVGPTDQGITVRQIAERVRAVVAPAATIRYGTGNKGWVGDVPRFFYSIERLLATGWRPRWGSEEAVFRAVDEIAAQER